MENYFNYFTEIEERSQQCRGTKTLLSPLDWALIESWKDSGIPLEAVLAGMVRAFEKFRARQRKYKTVNALAYCTQEVLRAAEEARGGLGCRSQSDRLVGGRAFHLAGWPRPGAARLIGHGISRRY